MWKVTFLWHDYETFDSLLETTILVGGNTIMEEMVSMLCDEILKSYQAGFKEGIKIGYEAGANSLQDDQ